jgi:hypothetical protein
VTVAALLLAVALVLLIPLVLERRRRRRIVTPGMLEELQELLARYGDRPALPDFVVSSETMAALRKAAATEEPPGRGSLVRSLLDPARLAPRIVVSEHVPSGRMVVIGSGWRPPTYDEAFGPGAEAKWLNPYRPGSDLTVSDEDRRALLEGDWDVRP